MELLFATGQKRRCSRRRPSHDFLLKKKNFLFRSPPRLPLRAPPVRPPLRRPTSPPASRSSLLTRLGYSSVERPRPHVAPSTASLSHLLVSRHALAPLTGRRRPCVTGADLVAIYLCFLIFDLDFQQIRTA
ncbi:hypothetical protein VPH35_106247 [Triticum aestivum]